jgi:hypothetical protein
MSHTRHHRNRGHRDNQRGNNNSSTRPRSGHQHITLQAHRTAHTTLIDTSRRHAKERPGTNRNPET